MITKDEREKNLHDWFNLLNKPVRVCTQQVLENVQKMRDAGEVIYPA